MLLDVDLGNYKGKIQAGNFLTTVQTTYRLFKYPIS